MTITQMLGQSGLLTLLGMCVVFGFIIIMILCMKLLHVLVHALKLDKEEKPVQKNSTASAPASVSASSAPAVDNGAVIAAIAAAVHDKAINS